MREKITALVETVLGVEPGTVTENTAASDLAEWDSLAQVLIIGELESRLGISIPLEEAAEIYSIKDIFEKAGV